MSDWILIRPHFATAAGGGYASWIVCDAQGQQRVAPQSGALADAARVAAGLRVALLVPGVDVLATTVTLPPRGGARLLQAVPFALEEQLADDIDTQHFAIGARAASGETPVAVVSLERLRGWLDALAAAGIEPDACYVDRDLLPVNPGQFVLLLEGDTLHVARPDGSRLTLPAAPLQETLEIAVPTDAPAPDEGTPLVSLQIGDPAGALVYASPADWEANEAQFEALRARMPTLRSQLLPQGALPLLARGAVEGRAINLLQGAFARRRESHAGFAPWRVAAGLAAALLLVAFGGQIWERSRLSAEEQRLDAALRDVTRATFGDDDVGTAKRRMEDQLVALRAGGGDAAGLLPALAALAQARSSAPESVIQSVGFDAGAVQVRVRAPNAETLERLSAALRSTGWQAELQGGAASGDGYEGRISLRMGG